MSWVECQLGDILTLKRGYDLPHTSREDGDIPVVSSSGITGYHNTAKLEGPAVVTGRYGTLGEVYYVEGECWPLNTALYVHDFKGNRPKFVYYFLQSVLKGMQSDKAAVPGVNRNDLHARRVKCTKDLNLQAAVEEFISPYDDLIENNLRRMQLLEESARLLYQEWFVQLRFPGHEQVQVANGLPDGWERKQLTAIAEVNQSSLKKDFDDRIEYIDISCVSTHLISNTTWYDFADAPGRARRIVKHCDILWSCVRPNRRSHVLVWKPHDRLIASTGLAVISATGVSPFFLYQYLTTNEYVGYLTNRAGGAAYPAVTAKVFEESFILVPNKKIIEQYDDQVEDIYAQINLLGSQNHKLAQARDLLLPKLMSGEIAV
jgi:type I restriction enzyme S subunit